MAARYLRRLKTDESLSDRSMSSPTQQNSNSLDIVVTFTTCNCCGSTSDYCYCAMTTLTPHDYEAPCPTTLSSSPLSAVPSKKGEPCSLHLSPAGCCPTAPILLESSWATQQKSVRSAWTKETNEWRRDQILAVRRRMDGLRQSFLTVPVAPKGESIATVQSDVPAGQGSPVSSSEHSEPASLTKSSAWDAGTPCAPVAATPSPSSSATPMTWKELTKHVAEARPRSSAVLVTKKPLRFKTKEERTKQRLKKRLWRYVPHDEVLGEGKRHAEEEEHTLLLHDAPLTRSQLRTYRRNSGSMYPRATSPSRSCTMAAK
jgi:hypothetical protein